MQADTAHQLAFDLPHRPALGRSDFFVSEANALALTLIDGWQEWPPGGLILTGPEGAGKTHLAHVFAQQTGAQVLCARDLPQANLPALTRGPLALEDLDATAQDPAAQEAAFHLWNMARAAGQPLLITGTGAPRDWGITLPDLRSRLGAMQLARLEAPDDALLATVLIKLFADRQITVAPTLIDWLVTRIDRSLAEAARTVEHLDRAALAQGRAITRPFAAQTLASISQNRHEDRG